ncbi:MAG: FkbM family methyltransferase [Bacteroidia bacterium]
MKTFIKKLIAGSGFEIRRINPFPIGSTYLPMTMKDLFEGVKFRGMACETFLDGGANTTTVSQLIKSIYPAAKCVLIEPMTELEPYLKKFCGEFKDSKYFLAGLAAKKDTLTFTVSDAPGASTFMYDSDESKKQRKVQVITIDDLIEAGEMQVPQIIKLDIQGFELEALKAATKTFGKTELYILEAAMFKFEDSPNIPDFNDTIDFMRERNYVPYEFPGFLRRPYDGAVGSTDIAFVQKNGMLRKSAKW